MTRKTVALTREDAAKLDRLVKKERSDASKVVRMAIRFYFEARLNKDMEDAYRRYYESPDKESGEIADDFAGASAPLW